MIDHDKLKKTRAGTRGTAGWKPKDGPNRVRLLPPRSIYLANWDALEDLAIKTRMHYFKMDGRPTEVSRCLEEVKKRCPACDVWRTLRKSDTPAVKEAARGIAPADQCLMNIIDLANPQAGIQWWNANYTCWNSIMEIAANPAWGNVVDPADGVDFVITMTAGSRSRTTFNAYSVLPEPQRTDIRPLLAALPGWEQTLDTLEDHLCEEKSAEEIRGLLAEMGFVVPGAGPRVGAPVAAMPVPSPVVAPAVAMPVSAPVHAHYDPGQAYAERVPASERPAGAPRCFGDFNMQQHDCRPCPASKQCQLKTIGVI